MVNDGLVDTTNEYLIRKMKRTGDNVIIASAV